MRASAELMACLTPRIVDLASLGAGFGELKPLDLAAALSGLALGPYSLARCAWVDDRSGWEALVGLVEGQLRVVGASWRGVIALAAAEYCWPPSCSSCAGRGEVKKQEYYGGCPACNGSGYGKIGSSVLADQCGVSSEEWKRTWAPRYEKVFRLVSSWGSEALCHLKRRLSDEK